MASDSAWPELPVRDWQPTRDTLILWLQVIGKIRIARAPLLNHWWNAPLYVTSRGLTTSLIPAGAGRSFSIDLDLVEHRLDVTTTRAETRSLKLEPKSVKDFYAELTDLLDGLDLATEIWPVPVELPDAIPFGDDATRSSYDPVAVTTFWRTLVEVKRVFDVFRARFVGKSSPVHLFWGALDLAATRFSGRTAPPHPGGVPNCGPHVMHEAYSHEVSSSGYWPGGEGEGLFYSYAYPEPDGYRTMPAGPDAATFDHELDEFVLPYTAVRTARNPNAELLDFLQRTYEAAAIKADWNRAALERGSRISSARSAARAVTPSRTPHEFFSGHPFAVAVFENVREIVDRLGPVEVRVSKSQVAFRLRRGFAYLWIPGRYLRKPTAEVVLSIALGRRDASPRFKEVAHPTPAEWMHHLEIHQLGDLDDEVANWLREAAERAR